MSESDSGIALETAEDVSIPNGPDLYVVFFSLFLLDASAATNWAFQMVSTPLVTFSDSLYPATISFFIPLDKMN